MMLIFVGENTIRTGKVGIMTTVNSVEKSFPCQEVASQKDTRQWIPTIGSAKNASMTLKKIFHGV